MTSTPTAPSTSSSSSCTLISSSSFLHLAPTHLSSNSSSNYTRTQLRQLVLEYLTSSCYAHSAKAFAREVDRREGEEQQGEEQQGSARFKRKQSLGAMRMEGVEATELDRDGMLVEQEQGEGDDNEDQEVERSLVKSVAFKLDRNGVQQPHEEEEEEQEEEEGWSLLSKAQLDEVRLRRDIRDLILSGRIQPAVELITEHFPSVLASPPPPSPSPGPPPTSTLLKASKQPCLPTTFFVSTPPTTSQDVGGGGGGGNDSIGLGATFGSWSLSLSPAILSLNLQLQTFVELMRAAHSPPSNPSTPLHPTAGAHSHLGDSLLSTSTSSLSSTTTTTTMNHAITLSQALNSCIQRLPPGKEREQWERECIDVCGLLAYKDLQGCPVRGYLRQERREVLAELVNAAILQHTNHTPLPLLSLVARQTTALWSTLAEWKVQFPPPTGGGGGGEKKEGGSSKEKGRVRTYPHFDLRTFLNEREREVLDPSITTTGSGSGSGSGTASR